MDSNAIFEHWTNWAETYGTALRATTKTPTAKFLELDAFTRRLQSILGNQKANILEIGCGNGINCIPLAKHFPNIHFDGLDYVAQMISAAHETLASEDASVKDRVRFFQANALELDTQPDILESYDVVFTDRCLINIKPLENQKLAISKMATKLKPGGHLLMIENSIQTFEQQNQCRKTLDLPPRDPADYNLFFDDDEILGHLASAGLELVEIEDFISLHDLLLYVLVPAINGGTVDYEHPIVKAAATLNRAVSATTRSSFGQFGQNRLYCCRKTA